MEGRRTVRSEFRAAGGHSGRRAALPSSTVCAAGYARHDAVQHARRDRPLASWSRIFVLVALVGVPTACTSQHESATHAAVSASGTAPLSSATQAEPVSTFIPDAWLAPEQLPFDSTYKWSQTGPRTVTTNDPGPLYTCSPPDTLGHLGSVGYQSLPYQRDSSTTNAGIRVGLLFFADQAHARQALADITTDYSECARLAEYDATTREPLANHVVQTVAGTFEMVYVHTFRRANGASGSPPSVASDNHEYFVTRGDVIGLIRVGGGEFIDDSARDATIVAEMSARLEAY
jgi:hypothetical protein